MIDIKEIMDCSQKSDICNSILRALPQWFGIEESILEYTKGVADIPFYAAFDDELPIGFIAVKIHNNFTAEVYVMGVLAAYHRQRIGASLISRVESYCQNSGYRYLTVKTLDESAISEPYERTRKFYNQVGFIPLEVFPTLWDERNPCLFLVKHL